MISECIVLGAVAGAFAGVMTVVIVYLMQRKLSHKVPKLPKAEFVALTGIVIFVGGIAWSRPLLMPVADPWCNQSYFCIAAALLLAISGPSFVRLITWCARSSPR
jgi:drug/metabolite transporter (DMT)-like permease